MAGKLYTEEETERLKRLGLDGRPWAEISRSLGRTEKAVRCKFHSFGLRRPRKGEWDTEELQTLSEMAALGYSAAQIGKCLCRTKNSVIGRAHRGGIKLLGKPGGRHKPRPFKPVEVAAMNECSEHPTLVELKERECHWPINNGGPFRYCGRPIAHCGTQYCSGHEAMKWKAPKFERVKVAA